MTSQDGPQKPAPVTPSVPTELADIVRAGVKAGREVPGAVAMIHRHITTSKWTAMAIESLFDRGTLQDWRELAAALKADPALVGEVRRVCAYRRPDGVERIAEAILPGAKPG
ncbi:MAG TPA: hypothetical protein VFC78_20775 [Tepidisphaeraceae bacterium]|nr:hypothetical protein [Tepidisphaeraceae bacterium]